MTSPDTWLSAQLVKLLGIRRRLARLADDGDPAAFRKRLDRLRRAADRRVPTRPVRRRWQCRTLDVEGSDLFVMTSGPAPSRRILLYLHGGGHMLGPFPTEWNMMGAVARATGCDFAVFLYPRAPEHQAPAALQAVRSAHARLEDEYGAGNVLPIGTSAGGGLALAFLADLRDRGSVLPPLAVLLSPGVDLTLRGEVGHLERGDVMLSPAFVRAAGTRHAGPLGPEHPTVSPLFGDLSGLPPLHVFVGSREILRPSLDDFAARAAAAGTQVHLIVGEGQQHTWPVAPTADGRRARRRIAEIVGTCG